MYQVALFKSSKMDFVLIIIDMEADVQTVESGVSSISFKLSLKFRAELV